MYSIHLWSIGVGGTSVLSICAFCYMLNVFSVVVSHRSVVNWRRGSWYMCILVSVELIWCSSIPYIYGQLDGYICPKYMCILLYVKLYLSVVVSHRSMVNWRRGSWYMCILVSVKLFGVVVFHTSMINWRGSICPKYMCILLYVKVTWCSGIPYIYGQLEGVHLP